MIRAPIIMIRVPITLVKGTGPTSNEAGLLPQPIGKLDLSAIVNQAAERVRSAVVSAPSPVAALSMPAARAPAPNTAEALSRPPGLASPNQAEAPSERRPLALANAEELTGKLRSPASPPPASVQNSRGDAAGAGASNAREQRKDSRTHDAPSKPEEPRNASNATSTVGSLPRSAAQPREVDDTHSGSASRLAANACEAAPKLSAAAVLLTDSQKLRIGFDVPRAAARGEADRMDIDSEVGLCARHATSFHSH
jgi:hypothetical protein